MGKRPPKKGGPKPPIRKSRKEIRKEQRQEKKLRRSVKYQSLNSQTDTASATTSNVTEKKIKAKGHPHSKPNLVEQSRNQEKSKQKVLEAQMERNRKKQLLVANKEEDKNIRHLEKLLFTRRVPKTKSIPKSFKEDGLGYLLEVCDQEMLKDSIKVDQALHESGSEFEEDFALVQGKKTKKKSKIAGKTGKKQEAADESDEEGNMEANEDSGSDFGLGIDDGSDEDMSAVDGDEAFSDNEDTCDDEDVSGNDDMDEDEDVSGNDDMDEDESEVLQSTDDEVDEFSSHGVLSSSGTMPNSVVNNKKEKAVRNSQSLGPKKKEALKKRGDDFDSDEQFEDDEEDENVEETGCEIKSDKTWEDIYGRLRDKEGNVVEVKPGKYIPPALRAKMENNEDGKRKESLARLRRQMKGLTNRLAENNMASICSQMDELFMKNSRNDMNETLLSLCTEALVTSTLTPERLVMEHVLLIAVLHANVGTEVGAHFLQNLMKKFQEMIDLPLIVENKELDNVVLILSHLYNFKVFSASLMYEVLDKIADSLDEKRIELLLLVLRSVGFSLRKDDPLALKSLILKVQEKANCSSASSTNSRVKFMLDILMAIKNNNVSKIPSYSPEHVEHLKKMLRTLVRRGNYVTELKITLDDILKVEERGRWWIVGSAWTGHLPGENPDANSKAIDPIKSKKPSESAYSAQLLELARKQRMNTDVRRDIFCVLMTAEDYLDAFEKLLHLNLKNQQRQEIVSVLFDCCLQEKSFNPYYAHLSLKFCDFDRQYQMKFQYCLWDKLKELGQLQNTQLINMAKLLAHLFLEKGLPLSALKVMSFAEMDKPCIRLVRQILLLILLSEDLSKCEAVFRRIAPSPQLHLFREGLRLFIEHFVVRKGSKSLPQHEFELLQDRARIAEKALSASDTRLAF